MKLQFSSICIFLIVWNLTITNTYSQATAVGYAGVEIVESATASSSPITSFEFRNDPIQSGYNSSLHASSKALDLGEVRINSSSAVSCNMILNPVTLKDSQGNSLDVTLSARTSNHREDLFAGGNETVKLQGTAHLDTAPVAGQFSGSYTLVFAFN